MQVPTKEEFSAMTKDERVKVMKDILDIVKEFEGLPDYHNCEACKVSRETASQTMNYVKLAIVGVEGGTDSLMRTRGGPTLLGIIAMMHREDNSHEELHELDDWFTTRFKTNFEEWYNEIKNSTKK